MVIRVEPEAHDEIVGDCTLFGYSLIPIGEYWFLNSDHLDVRKIDYSILQESIRHLSIEMLRDMRTMLDNAVGMDAKHQKAIQSKSLYEIPELAQQPQQNMRQ